ncbi:unnamed protein product [Spirodela intermedia]|uniref:C2H2-type domain-containing protein n=1 Tax=Spirodela intermedia TaxID=51605 RepID=A0A7I8KQG0_SPIIN|nr:unnamed protein product [Spirodela intermedia]
MDAKKALFRAKLREAAQKREKRIDSPLVRYNEYDQPVCKVCNVTLKSESLWPAHQVSRKHREAIENVKALATARDHHNVKSDRQKDLEKPQPSSKVASEFFDKPEIKRQKIGGEESSTVEFAVTRSQIEASSSTNQESRKVGSSESKQAKGSLPDGFFDKEISASEQSEPMAQPFKRVDAPTARKVKGVLPEGFFDDGNAMNENISWQPSQPSTVTDVSEVKQAKGALPEGFFDNKDADLRARGIQPVKVDISDAYKEFEKEIQDDLLEVDDRLEEEEIDAAEMRQEFERVEQREYRERVEMVKKRLMEAKAVQNARGQKRPAFMRHESSDESSTDEEETFAVDWRAKHL